MLAIDEFTHEHAWLSNFYAVPVALDGVLYPSVEHAYQAAKTLSPEERTLFKSGAAGSAKKLGRSVTLRADWNEVKLEVMRALLKDKFAAGTILAQRLLDTGDRELIEGNWWGDTFWGMCNGRGQNNLGKLLMQRREELR